MTKKRDLKFIADMEAAGIPWRSYSGRGMFGRECPCACTRQGREVDGEWQEGVSEEDIIRATTVKGLRRDNMGLGMVLYTG